MQQQQRRRGLLLLWGLPGCWLAWAAPLGRQTSLANLLHELASNEECKQSCCCRACWNGLQPC